MTDKTVLAINREIEEFITANKVATLCGAEDNKPHCFNCFYSFEGEDGWLIFKSSGSTKHMQVLSGNKYVAGTVISQEISMTKIEGIQFEGVVIDRDFINFKATRSYYTRFPFAVTVPGKIWVIELHSIKYTNTTNGIRRKEEWKRI